MGDGLAVSLLHLTSDDTITCRCSSSHHRCIQFTSAHRDFSDYCAL